jgi:short-subunit dehydrogenase
MDVTDTASVEAGVAQIMEEQGRIDVLFNNAGYGLYGTIECVPIEEIQHQYNVNVLGMARCIKAVLPQMRERRDGLIINMASTVGRLSTPVLGWYASSKHAVVAISDALRMEVKHLGVDVVIIEPGFVKTGFNKVAFSTLDQLEYREDYNKLITSFKKLYKKFLAKSPNPESTANAVLKAIKAKRPKNRYITTIDAQILPKVRQCVGDRLFDKLVMRQLM